MKCVGFKSLAIAVVLVLFGGLMGCVPQVAGGGVTGVVGVVKFEGPVPKRKPIPLSGKGSDCHKVHKTVLLDENLLVSKMGEVANVFVYVKEGLTAKEYPVPKTSVLLNQDKCMFRPRVQGIRTGQKFRMKNSDPLIHNVRSLSLKNRPFNIAQPAGTADREKVFTAGEKIRLQCDFHPWMMAYVFVMEHPYFAVTDEKGQFQIEGLAAGTYTLGAWHEELGEQEAKITVDASGSAKVGFTFKPKSK
jgi:hypothetical protein